MSQLFIMLVGYSNSGKTTLAKKILRSLPQRFIRIDSDSLHDFLNRNYTVFRDNQTIYGKSFSLRNQVTRALQDCLLKILLSHGQSVILDTCNLVLAKRQEVFNLVRSVNKSRTKPDLVRDKKIKKIIIQVNIPKSQLLKNIRAADQKRVKQKKKKSWHELYAKIQSRLAGQKPSAKEADYFYVYNWKNFQQVIELLKKIE